mmetsp:Transcript_17323/g.45390  ORF Transcript_17323/g.45390 Transcript_17323/m.45390 type:complete len:294 (+) Transcript_17323:2771-3652(+)
MVQLACLLPSAHAATPFRMLLLPTAAAVAAAAAGKAGLPAQMGSKLRTMRALMGWHRVTCRRPCTCWVWCLRCCKCRAAATTDRQAVGEGEWALWEPSKGPQVGRIMQRVMMMMMERPLLPVPTKVKQQQQQQQLSGSAPAQPSLLPLSTGSVAVVTECLKALVAAAHFAGAAVGPAAQEAIMQVLLPLLVLAAAPSPPAHPTLSLKELAVKLITSLPGSPMGGPFKAALSGLPAASKQRLQAALKEPELGLVVLPGGTAHLASSQPMGSSGRGATAAARPTIQLKTTFAIPK